jgi:hypothetical protein
MRYEARDVRLDTGAIVNIVVQLDNDAAGSQFVSSIESSGRVDGMPLSSADQSEIRFHILGESAAELRTQDARVSESGDLL